MSSKKPQISPGTNRLPPVQESKSKDPPRAAPSILKSKATPGPSVNVDEDAEDATATYLVVPPDGGWGWMVLIASIYINAISDGNMFAFGVFIPALTKEFESAKEVALIASVLTGTELLIGPLVGALCNRWGFRIVAIIGCLTTSVAFAVSYFATSTAMLCVVYGFIGGFGVGMAYMPANLAVGFYFERWRGLTSGLASCGSSLGGTVLTQVFTVAIDKFGWRKAMLIQGAIVSSGAIFALMFRPLKPVRVVMTPSDVESLDGGSLLGLLSRMNSKQASRFVSLGRTNADYPTLAQLAASGTKLQHGTSFVTSIPGASKGPSVMPSRRVSVDDTVSIRTVSMRTVYTPKRIMSGGSVMIVAGEEVTTRRSTRCTISCCSFCCCKRNKKVNDVGVRPMYRDDALYTGSLKLLPEYKSTGGSIGYHMTVTRLATTNDVEEELSTSCFICPEAVTRALATMLDFSLLRSPSFMIFCLSGGFTFMGYYIPYMYITDRASHGDVDPDKASYLLMSINISNMIGRVIGGLLGSSSCVSTILVNNVSLTAAGVCTIVSGLAITLPYQLAYCVVFGFSMGCFATQRTLILVELLGLEKLTNAFGLLLMNFSIFNIVGLTVSGALIDAIESFEVVFWYAGASILAAAVMLYPLKWVNNREKARTKERIRNTTILNHT